MGCGSGQPLSAASVFPAAAPAVFGLQCLGCFHARLILLMPHSAERVESAAGCGGCDGCDAGDDRRREFAGTAVHHRVWGLGACMSSFRLLSRSRPERPDFLLSPPPRNFLGRPRRLQLGWTPASEFPDMSLHYRTFCCEAGDQGPRGVRASIERAYQRLEAA